MDLVICVKDAGTIAVPVSPVCSLVITLAFHADQLTIDNDDEDCHASPGIDLRHLKRRG